MTTETQTHKVQPGMAVIRKASEKDYTNGRKGTIQEVDYTAERARVLWTQERTGHAIKIRTWVKFSALIFDNG
jgi:hypothetical protein